MIYKYLHFTYDSESGLFTSYGKKIKGSIDSGGYIRFPFNKKRVAAHRLAWLMVYKKWPEKVIDHINGIKIDNRISNLRDVSRRENHQNMKIHRNGKLVGASFIKSRKHWASSIRIKGKDIFLGHFKTEIEAHNAYIKAIKELL